MTNMLPCWCDNTLLKGGRDASIIYFSKSTEKAEITEYLIMSINPECTKV